MKRQDKFSFYRLLSVVILLAFSLVLTAQLGPADAQQPGPKDGKPNSADKALPDLLNDLNSPNPSVASNAIFELKGMKIPAKEALPALISALKNQSEFVRLGAVNAIAEFGPEAAPALNGLLATLKDKDALVREAAALAILGIGPAAKKSIPELALLLSDDSKKTRDVAVMALAVFGSDSVPVLIKSLESPDQRISSAAAESLARIGGPALDQLVVVLKKGGPGSENASTALSAIGKASVPPLISLLKDSNPEISKRASDTLAAIGTAAIPGLIEAVRNR